MIFNAADSSIYTYKYIYMVLQHWKSLWKKLSIYIFMYVCIYISKLATVVVGDQKAPFSIATTPRCWEGCYSFPWITLLYSWYVPYVAEWEARRYLVPFLKSLVWRDLGLNPSLPGHWRTLYPLDQYIYIVCVCVCVSVSVYVYCVYIVYIWCVWGYI